MLAAALRASERAGGGCNTRDDANASRVPIRGRRSQSTTIIAAANVCAAAAVVYIRVARNGSRAICDCSLHRLESAENMRAPLGVVELEEQRRQNKAVCIAAATAAAADAAAAIAVDPAVAPAACSCDTRRRLPI